MAPSPLTKVAVTTEQLLRLRHERELAICQAIDDGATWAELAGALGISAQAAHKRYRWLRYSPDHRRNLVRAATPNRAQQTHQRPAPNTLIRRARHSNQSIQQHEYGLIPVASPALPPLLVA